VVERVQRIREREELDRRPAHAPVAIRRDVGEVHLGRENERPVMKPRNAALRGSDAVLKPVREGDQECPLRLFVAVRVCLLLARTEAGVEPRREGRGRMLGTGLDIRADEIWVVDIMATLGVR